MNESFTVSWGEVLKVEMKLFSSPAPPFTTYTSTLQLHRRPAKHIYPLSLNTLCAL